MEKKMSLPDKPVLKSQTLQGAGLVVIAFTILQIVSAVDLLPAKVGAIIELAGYVLGAVGFPLILKGRWRAGKEIQELKELVNKVKKS